MLRDDYGLGDESIFDRYWMVQGGEKERPVEVTLEVPPIVKVPVKQWLRGTGGNQSALWDARKGMGCITGHLCVAAGVPVQLLAGCATLAVLRSRGVVVTTPKPCPMQMREENPWYLLYNTNDVPEKNERGEVTMGPNRRMMALQSMCRTFLGVDVEFVT